MTNKILELIKDFSMIPFEGDYSALIFDDEKMRKMEYHLITGENFGIAGHFGTGKTSVLNYLEEFAEKKKLGAVIRVGETLCNEDVFYRKLMYALLEKKLVKKVFGTPIAEIEKKVYSTQSLEDFLRSLIYYEPRKQLDHSRVIQLYKEYLKESLDMTRETDFILNTYTIRNLVIEILRNSPKRVLIFIDDYDKFTVDPLSREGGENRLGLFLSSLKEITELSKTTWVFALPQTYYEKFSTRIPFENELNFLGMFTEMFTALNFNLGEVRKFLIIKAEKLGIFLNDLIEESAVKMLYVLTKGNPKMINYLIKNALYSVSIRKGKKINIGDMLSIMKNGEEYDDKDIIICRYIAETGQSFSNDKALLKDVGIENVNLMIRLERLKKKDILVSDFHEGIKYFKLKNVS